MKNNHSHVSELLRDIAESYRAVLGDNLVGIYIHGSLAFGCFVSGASDVDYIAVVKNDPEPEQKTAIIRETLRLELQNPPKGLEMHILSLTACKNFSHPCPFLLHYSAFHRGKAEKDPADFAFNMHGTDPDLAAHITVMNAVGIPLFGPNVADIFSPVPEKDYLDSIMFDVNSAEEEISQNPVYFILNLCRVLAHIREQKILSKADGGKWGLKNLPPKFSRLIYSALLAYCGSSAYLSSSDEEKAFARFALKEIRASLKEA